MGDDQQETPQETSQEAEQRRRSGIDLRNYDPRKITDPAMRDRIIHAQAVARAEAQAVSTVLIATIVSLVTSAFTFVAALAWNTAIQQLLNENINSSRFASLRLSQGTVDAIYAMIVTIIAVIVVFIVNRFAGNIAKKSAIAAATK
ncbi:MAG TPA: DUF5654 family protein [Ktedonobacterales bacterium]|nr:DUF5654 family protein [Ktedonobacterales bacterium]